MAYFFIFPDQKLPKALADNFLDLYQEERLAVSVDEELPRDLDISFGVLGSDIVHCCPLIQFRTDWYRA